MKKAVIIASVASMIDLFNMENIKILKSEGYEVDVVANFSNGSNTSKKRVDEFKLELESMGIKVFNLPIPRNIFNLIDIFSSLKELIEIMNVNNYSLMHCHSPIGGAIGRLAARSARKKGTKVIYTAHGFHFFKGAPLVNWLAYYPAERWLARYTDVLITINTEDYEIAKKFNVNRIEYVPGVGIDTDKFKNIEVNRTEKRESLGVSEDDFMIISVGELNKNKNHQVIIRAIAKLRNEKIKYVLCGQGPLETELRELAKELDVENQVKFLGFRKDVPDLMKVADLFAFPSYREGLSLSLMEAMASGLPVVCSEIRGNTDLIEDGKGGYLVKPSDVEGFAKYIKELIEDSKLKSELGGFNLEKIEHYSIENVLCEMEDIYFN